MYFNKINFDNWTLYIAVLHGSPFDSTSDDAVRHEILELRQKISMLHSKF